MTLTSEYFDGWYADMATQPKRDELFREHLGLPAEFESTSLLTFAGLLEVRDLLDLGPDAVLLDLACGRGGYGRWLARETGARLIGVDFSSVAIGHAQQTAATAGLGDRAEFRVGELEAIGLPDAHVDAVLCVDAIQFAADIAAAAAEIRRVLRPGGRAVVTCWEARDRGDERLSERLRRIDLGEQLSRGGLADVRVEERLAWHEAERSLWQAAVAIEPGDDPALASLKEEGDRVLPDFDRCRRVLATAHAPVEAV